MQREKNVLFIILALAFALLATGALFLYMKNYEDRIISEAGMTVSVVAANVDLKSGAQIRDYMLTTTQWPKNKVLDHHIANTEDVIGKTLKMSISKGMPILRGFLLKKGDNLSYFVPDKMRAMTLKFDERTSDTLMVSPGSFVDILATFSNRGSSPFTKTILQNVKVIAVNGKTEEDYDMVVDKKVKEVTVLIKPEATEALALAKTQAQLQIVLRNINDSEEMEKSGIDEETIIYGRSDDDEKTPKKKLDAFIKNMPLKERTVKIIRGTEVQEIRTK